MLVIPSLKRLRQKDGNKFKVNLVYIVCLRSACVRLKRQRNKRQREGGEGER